ncbi:MAG: TonB-dependent receptor [Calditrichaeota bacterium]|nr:TonB-dependent receptor [Calditrichota bacterium]
MFLRKNLIFFLTLVATVAAYGQADAPTGAAPAAQRGGILSGAVVDAQQGAPIEYANIVLTGEADTTLKNGTITNDRGQFLLEGIRPGRYRVEVFFLGYETQRFPNVRIAGRGEKTDLGSIKLSQTLIAAEGVSVEGERAAISYQIDKKVISVDQQHTSASGSAIDVLENVPSVTVDIEGNVSLRGSGNFRVLIDGRPTILDPADALEQVPAGTIDNIEIITNPSARYDPEGTAGIINIILKKNRQKRRSAMVNLNSGLRDKYGADFLGEYHSDRYSLTVGLDYNNRNFTGEGLQENTTSLNGTSSYIYSDGDNTRGHESMGLRAELGIDLTPNDHLSFSGRYGDRSFSRDAEQDFQQWSQADPARSNYTSLAERGRSGERYQLAGSFQHNFAGKGHQVMADLSYRYGNGDEITTNELRDAAGVISDGQRSTESGPGRELEIKLDYTLPLGEERKFEAGYQSELQRDEEETGLALYEQAAGGYVNQPLFGYLVRSQQDEHALYTLYAGKWGNLGYQGGLRAEYTDRLIELVKTAEQFTIDRWDFFPSAHISYHFADGRQMMTSYTRRIDRPRAWNLEPFQTWMDAYNVRTGNPALKPEYIDSYELGYQTFFGKNLFSVEGYHRRTINKIEQVRSVYDENVTLHTVENIGRDYASGSELLLNLALLKRWDVNLMGNVYHYRVEGRLLSQDFSRESINWGSRISNTFKIRKNLQLQLDGDYRSPSVSAQGRREGFFVTNTAVKYDVLPQQLSVTLQVRDLFGTARYEFTSRGADFYNYSYFTRESPIVMLNVRYNFNHFKQKRDQRGAPGGEGEDEF